MSKANVLAEHFLSQSQQENAPSQQKTPQGLMRRGPINSFRDLFDYKELDAEEAQEIEDLLWQHTSAEQGEEQLQKDAEALQHLTAEIRSISKQGVILLGERIHKAQKILVRYGDGQGAFTQWLVSTFGNRRSAYNMLAYYEFYSALPTQELRSLLKAMPVQAVYSLASRKGSLEDKLEIIRLAAGKKQREILALIQERLPLPESDGRRSTNPWSFIDNMERSCSSLNSVSSPIDDEQRKRIRHIISKLEQLL